MSDDLYCFPNSTTLRNRLGITDPHALDEMERELVAQRLSEGTPRGDFDLPHLRAIHRHLFQDVYEWAGELREVEIAKGGSQFMSRRFIGSGMADVHQRLTKAAFLRGLDHDAFAREAGTIIGDINHIHPFREGNGRTQLEYLRQLGEQAGRAIDVRKLDGERWHQASRAAHLGDYRPMAQEIGNARADGQGDEATKPGRPAD